jgi:hypothetical protein
MNWLKWQQIVSPLLIASLVFGPWVQAAQSNPGDDKPSPGYYLDKIDQLMSAAEAMRSSIDRSAFDLDVLLDNTDYEAENIISFVKEEVGFEQYPGTLRGPLGTLMSRSGNALDQSILLAKLLRDAGFDARIARGRLDDAQARELLNEMRLDRPAYPAIGSAPEFAAAIQSLELGPKLDDAQLEQLAHTLAEPPPVDGFSGLDTVRRQTGEIEGWLQKAGVTLGSTDSLAAAVAEAQDYFWVQFRDSAASPWSNVHPGFREAPSFDLSFTEVFTESIPAELQHRFRFQVFIERAIAGRLDVMPISDPWERPTANLNGTPLVYTNIPDTMMRDLAVRADLAVKLEQASFFAPAFGSGLVDSARFFDSTGTLVDPEVANAAGAGIFKTLGGLFGDALGGTGGSGAPRLTAQWLEFTLIAPDGSERSYRRTTMDRLGPDARRRGEVPANLGPTSAEHLRPLLQRHTFMVSTGATPRAMAMDFALESLLKSRPLFEAIITEGSEPPSAATQPSLKNVPKAWAGHLKLFGLFDRAEDAYANGRQYRSGPALVVQREGLAEERGKVTEAIDIVQNPRRAFAWKDGELEYVPQAVAFAGIWETASEGSVISGASEPFNTGYVFEEAKQSGAPISVIRPGETASLDSLTADSLASIQQDLDRGFAIVVPNQEFAQGAGWWRVDPLTGETLGQIGSGMGGDMTEWVELATFALSVATACVGQLACMSSHGAAVNSGSYGGFACCSIWNAFLLAGGIIGGVVSAGVGTGWDIFGALTGDIAGATCAVFDG